MSRVGRKVIVVPASVKVSVSETALEVQGPKGKLTTPVPPGIKFALRGRSSAASARTTSGSCAPSTGWRARSPRTRSRA